MADALAPGVTLGSYRIDRLLGRGGMGEVYLALDLRLNRNVAIKVLSADMRGDSASLERFYREARAAASLHHSNVCTIYEIGETDDCVFLAMELCEGETLAERIAREPLPIEVALDLAIQTADALDEARRRGLVHRDIKSANLMVSERGEVKILDFGLAKHFVAPGEGYSRVSTLLALTGPGMVLGTPAYMSPEQLLEKPVDHRSDIFSFGVMLYEMLTRRRPFEGSSVAAVAAAIVYEEPPPLARYAGPVPDGLVRILTKMLAKDPEERYQSVHEVWVDLRRIRSELEASSAHGTVGGRSSRAWSRRERQPTGPAHDRAQQKPQGTRVIGSLVALPAKVFGNADLA